MPRYCAQCAGPVVDPRGIAFELAEGETSIYLYLCRDHCIKRYVSRALLTDKACVVARCSYEYDKVAYSVEYANPEVTGKHPMALPRDMVDNKLWDYENRIELPCTVCGETVKVPLYRTKTNRYYWPGTTIRYQPGHQPPDGCLPACSDVCAVSKAIESFLKPYAEKYVQIRGGLWLPESQAKSSRKPSGIRAHRR